MSEGKEGKADSRVEWIKENIKASLPNIKKDRLEKSFALEATVDAIHSFLEGDSPALLFNGDNATVLEEFPERIPKNKCVYFLNSTI